MKSKSRIKISLPTLTTREDAEFAMNSLALTVNAQRKLLADRDAALLKINDNMAGPLINCETQIHALTDQLRAWAEANPDQFQKGRKSIELTSGSLGFRTGTPKLSLLNRAWSWEKVLKSLLDSCMGTSFIRTKEEVDKDALLGCYATKTLSADQLASAGLRVTQDESFFVEPDLTSFETRQIQTEAA